MNKRNYWAREDFIPVIEVNTTNASNSKKKKQL